ncbi:MAG: 3,4-dihydroxy-2-butanone-4-phosphate synthase [Proteobacteria bacterium]|nr:3,4-dihydroxy-2-butanone-4-phosphate synthase [Pseudomonadota bacterium]
MPYSEYLSSIEDIITEASNGRMFILVDDQERENEGDLVIPGQMATPDAINFMAKHGRGLICLTLTASRLRDLDLPLMAQRNNSRHETAFTVSIEARKGVTTGISASDRARTVAVAIDPSKGVNDIVSPGHVFPLEARDGGVLVRAGHTEAAVDVSRLAGLNPSGVICEIMNEDGTMARMPDLIKFAQFHGLKIGTIADLIAYRRKHDKIIERSHETTLETGFGGPFKMYVYTNTVEYAEHIALVKGDLSKDGPTMVRVHALNVLDDVLGDLQNGKAGELQKTMEMIGGADKGVLVLIREPLKASLTDQIKARAAPPDSKGPNSPPGPELRDYGVGAQILLDLGVKDMIVLSNTERTLIALEGYGLSVTEHRPITGKDG